MKKTLLISIILLSGCANPKYIPPTEGPIATIEFKNTSGNLTKTTLGPIFFENQPQCIGQRSADTIPAGQSFKYDVQANTEVTFGYYLSLQSGNREFYCLNNIRFTPKNGGKYTFSGEMNNGICTSILIDDDTKEKANYKLIEWRTPFTGSGSFCRLP